MESNATGAIFFQRVRLAAATPKECQPAMYVCSCNAITDRQIRAAAKEAAGSPTRCYLCLGFRPQCGKCLPRVRAILAQMAAEDEEARTAPANLAAE